MEPAERLDRFWAAVIDRALVLPLVLGAAIFVPAMKDNAAGMFLLIGVSAVLTLALVGYQLRLLTTLGQTIGKKALGVRIVLVKDDSNGGFVVNVLLRGVVTLVLSAIPGIGFLFALADVLFIFRDDRRCIHDHIAGTRVVKA